MAEVGTSLFTGLLGVASGILADTFTLPTYVASVSVVILLLQLALRLKATRARRSSDNVGVLHSDGLQQPNIDEYTTSFSRHIAHVGGPTIFAFRTGRFFACLVLLGLSVFTVYSRNSGWGALLESASWIHIGLCGVYAYASLLALASLVTEPCLGRLFTRHLTLLLTFTWAVHLYRNIWPLATFTLTPADAAEGSVLWIKSLLLTIAAVVVPLLVPRQYIPLDPKDPFAVPAEEQTASLLSLVLYIWLNKTVYEASSGEHLPLERFPRLTDREYAKNLVPRAYPYIDPFQSDGRHLFFGFTRIFAAEFVEIGAMLIFRVLATFASPLVINRVLNYLETGGADAFVRPWFWISWLFLGPMIFCIAFQWYFFVSKRVATHAQAMLMHLVFDHALRMRVKAETSDSSQAASSATTAVPTPETRSIAEVAQGSASSGDETEVAGSPPKDTPRAEDVTTKMGDKAGGKNLVGKLNNLITADVANVGSGSDFLFFVVELPIQVSLCVYFLYQVLGWSAFVGMVVMCILLPAPGFLAKSIQGVQVDRMKKSDSRIQSVTETMNMIRMVKLFGWERRVGEELREKREEELTWLRKFKVLSSVIVCLTHLVPLVTLMTTYGSFTLIQKGKLTASRVFSSMAVMTMLRDELNNTLGLAPRIIQAKVSLDRINEFLHKTELLDVFTSKINADTGSELVDPSTHAEPGVLGIREATFSWAADGGDNDGMQTPGNIQRRFLLRIEKDVTFKRGCINLIVGPTGSGKTSLLMALLGEMHYIPVGPGSFVSLPRTGGVAYAAQESWVQSETIRDNILFGAPYDEERYNKVIEQCALTRDLTLFEAGDKTEVGEKGLTLSGGQKARITLARAVYSSAEILLLDDVLAALDVHTAHSIVEQCFKGDLIRGRTVLLVTHNVTLASPVADFVVSLGKDGRVRSQGTLAKALAEDKDLSAELLKEVEEEVANAVEADVVEKKGPSSGKLVVAEEISLGRVGWPAWKMFLTNLGGKHPAAFWVSVVITMMLTQLLWTSQTWFLGTWAKQYEIHAPEEVAAPFYLLGFSMFTVFAVLFYWISCITFILGTLRAGGVLHHALIESVLGTTLRWLDVTPTARIIARCTADFNAIDGAISDYSRNLFDLLIALITFLGAVFVASPVSIPAGILLIAVGAWLAGQYVGAQLSAQRELNNTNAPLVEHFSAAMAGLTSVRAYGVQKAFARELCNRIDRHTRADRTLSSLYRWILCRVEPLNAAFTTALAVWLVYGQKADASRTGFTLNMAATFGRLTIYFVVVFNELQVKASSLERVQQYMQIEQESQPTKRGVPPAYWPASGDLRVENLSARYSSDGPKVLNDLSFEIKSGERVGIVGRTGSGKSSLTLALLRCILTEGKVYYDGLPTDSVNLDALRSKITIIPQLPELLSGTVRQNLDPFQEHDDAVLNDALRAAGLYSVQSETDEARITLDTQIASGGGNMSVGQRQILALARAIVRQSKLLILDEATSAIDYETDTAIQTSLRKELGKDVTLLTVAHRLQTIMDADKIMVLDAGRIVEFGPPQELLAIEKGMLRALVDQSGDKDTLYSMAAGRR